ncbi:DUF1287 domain-containing protein [Haloferula chungangensis]|uniref:DUF1287 domain-containing protein n=1 Tax=Haloferula chungangensis TaxID=1048331 RepID=A0ABW2L725_9BACT
MPRRSSNRLDTIEYIGPRPVKPQKRPNFLGGWVVLLIAAGAAYFFGKDIWVAQAQQVTPTSERAVALISELQPSANPGERLAAAALQRAQAQVSYEDAYYAIPYPNGDIPLDKGRAEDLLVRSYRAALGIDLQTLVHEDMSEHFSEYPQIFSRKTADANIDHRLTPNLQRFFRRMGAEISVADDSGQELPSRVAADYLPGDVVAWRLPGGRSHIGIIVPGPGDRRAEPWVVHNRDAGPVWENCLFDSKITGHYRFFGKKAEKAKPQS